MRRVAPFYRMNLNIEASNKEFFDALFYSPSKGRVGRGFSALINRLLDAERRRIEPLMGDPSARARLIADLSIGGGPLGEGDGTGLAALEDILPGPSGQTT